VPPDDLDPLLIPLLDRIQSQLDRLEGDIDRINSRFDGFVQVHTELGNRISETANRITAIETWRAGFVTAVRDRRVGREWLVGAVIAGIALAVSIAGALHL
jgi:hypothetical protein